MNEFNTMFNIFRSFKKSYLPSYNDLADYNTNAQSYYDYLAKFNKLIELMCEYINELMRRDVKFNDTTTIDVTKLKSWINCNDNLCEEKNTEILFKADVIFSKLTTTFETLRAGTVVLNNATRDNVGVFTPDYSNILKLFDNDINKNINDIDLLNKKLDKFIDKIEKEIDKLKNEISNINDEIINLKEQISNIKNDNSNLKTALQKIINNLNNAGAVSNNNMNTFNFVDNIAHGNINIFSKSVDGNYYIKTNKNRNQYDIAMGVDE